MSECQHEWLMTDVQFGFIAFERCFHCSRVRTFFSLEISPDLGEEYREGQCFWTRVENTQSFMFNLRCTKCDHIERFDDLMGLMDCTGCLQECEVEIRRRKYESEKTWIVVAFGFLPQQSKESSFARRLDILSDYFNQRRNTTRSRIKVLPSSLIPDLSLCRGNFIHDVGLLSGASQ